MRVFADLFGNPDVLIENPLLKCVVVIVRKKL